MVHGQLRPSTGYNLPLVAYPPFEDLQGMGNSGPVQGSVRSTAPVVEMSQHQQIMREVERAQQTQNNLIMDALSHVNKKMTDSVNKIGDRIASLESMQQLQEQLVVATTPQAPEQLLKGSSTPKDSTPPDGTSLS